MISCYTTEYNMIRRDMIRCDMISHNNNEM